MADKKYYCTVENDGVAVCVCRHRPCEKLKCKEQECEKLKELNNALSGQLNFVKSELELRLSAEIKRSKFILGEFKKTDKQRDYWRETAKKYKQALDKIEELCKDHPFCDCSCGQDILDIINKAKE